MTESPFFDAFNAKHKTEREIATTFVAPPTVLGRLLTRGHVIMSGPRGSGKTTLLKMLTVPALYNWPGAEAQQIVSKVDFLSVFIAADRSWHGQIAGLAKDISDPKVAELLGIGAFTTHIFKSIVLSLIDWRSPEYKTHISLKHLVPRIDLAEERIITSRLAELWQLRPRAFTLLELKAALSERLSIIGALRNKMRFLGRGATTASEDFLFLDYREGLRACSSICNEVLAMPGRRWSFLFDEIEIAPSFIQELLFSDLRSDTDEAKISYRLALAPFNKNFRKNDSDIGPSQKNDYAHIDLTYPRKKESYSFSLRLASSLISSAGFSTAPETMLGRSYFEFEDDADNNSSDSKYSEARPLGKVFRSLSEKDSSFREYLAKRRIDLGNVSKLDEASMASTLRKVRNVAVVRDFFSKASDSGLVAESLSNRSRKTFSLYTGVPSILALSEGNPRALINLMTPLIAEYASVDGKRTVSERVQAVEIEKSIRVMRSLLKTIPVVERPGRSVGLTAILDQVGDGFYRLLMSKHFRDQPALSFRVDRGASPHILSAIGKAINIGALIYVPDSSSEDIISNVVGRRFRLNYLLSAYYKLPLSFDREISLSSLIGPPSSQHQARLGFEDGH